MLLAHVSARKPFVGFPLHGAYPGVISIRPLLRALQRDELSAMQEVHETGSRPLEDLCASRGVWGLEGHRCALDLRRLSPTGRCNYDGNG